jgi:hypothetical protein
LHCASEKGHMEIVQYLIETCFVDKEAKNDKGKTASETAGNKTVKDYLKKVKVRRIVASQKV